MEIKKVKIITFGEIMMRLSPPGQRRFSQATAFDLHFGGSEANVAVSLANYGLEASFVTKLPDNELSGTMVSDLKKRAVNTEDIVYGGDRIGTYFLETGASGRGSKVIYDRKYSSFDQMNPGEIDWSDIFKDATWFHWSGVTPAVSENAAKACLLAVQEASKMGLRISTDLNMRHKLWNWGKMPQEIMPELVSYSDVLFGDMAAFKTMLGIATEYIDLGEEGIDPGQCRPTVLKLRTVYPKLNEIIVSFRNSASSSTNLYAGVLFSANEVFKSQVYKITDIVDRVGTGDAFVGGVIYGINKFNDLEKAIEFGVSAASLKHSILGDFNLITAQEVIDGMSLKKRTNISR
ncbi:sugar kinase [Zhouia spongiae]|uniref:Sugar kinase n=1 Tax=Zhouia spongiae TaxID=2202721 RepID=A0ABY3YHX3_9FLAO|nr:sugar kinase [Zhouia spongiae]UNY97239.1 sugar kinase [Zhouia spongiae]